MDLFKRLSQQKQGDKSKSFVNAANDPLQSQGNANSQQVYRNTLIDE